MAREGGDGVVIDALQYSNWDRALFEEWRAGGLDAVHVTLAYWETARDTLSRMETMVLMAGMDLPIRAIREQVASAVDLIVHQSRFKDGSRRITHITEVERMEGDVITLQDVFVYDHGAGFNADGKAMGTLRATGLRPKFLEKMEHANVRIDPLIFATGRL